MKIKMSVKALSLLLLGLIQLCHGTPKHGPIHEIKPTQAANDLVTQTVYGFLDFTTTIGNTVMVFSPKSAPPPEVPKPSAPPTSPPPSPSKQEVIDTKPVATVAIPHAEIKPSKTVNKNASNKPVSSVVQVVAQAPHSEHAVKPAQKPKVQIVSSNVEVVHDNIKSGKSNKKSGHSQVFSSHVEVKAGSPVSIVHQHEPKKHTVLPTVIEVQPSEDIGPVENNINDPEFELLSRQPSEFAEETYRVHSVRPPTTKFHQKSKSVQDSNAGKKSHQNRPQKPEDTHPTGLVTKLGGTVVNNGVTTVHETSVIGTYISGKYAQVLQSSSHIYQNSAQKPKIAPSPSLRILKTAAPHIPKKQHVVEATPARQSPGSATGEGDEINADEIYGNSANKNLVRSSRRPAVSSNSFKNRFQNRNNRPSYKEDVEYQDAVASTPEVSSTAVPNYKKNKASKSSKNNRFNRFSTSSAELSTTAVFSESATTPAYSNRRNKASRNGAFKPVSNQNKESSYQQQQQQQHHQQQSSASDNGHRRFKPKLQPTPPEPETHTTSSLYKFKLNRAPGRWQYKTSPKPRVTIRKSNGEESQPQVQQVTPSYEGAAAQLQAQDSQHAETQSAVTPADSRSDDIDLDSSSSVNGDVLNDEDTLNNVIESKKLPIETLKVEISTPINFKDTYYEIATIKSPYTFQAGSVKNTRYITVTSTFEKTLDPEPTISPSLTEPLTENILATTSHIDKEHNLLDSSIATLPPLLLSSGVETPPLETLTETFSTTQIMLKTHILPVIQEGVENATSYTLTQTYMVTRLVTATKTLPPMEAYHFNPTKALKEFNSKLDEAGSEHHLELDFGDDNENDEDDAWRQELPADLDLANIGSEFDISEVDKAIIPEGHLRPKKKITQKVVTEPPQTIHQQPQQQQPTPDPLMQNLSPDQLQQLALLRLLNPAAAAQIPQVITTSKPIIKLETVFESHVIPIFNGVSTSFSTISRPVATVSKTEYEIGTSTLPQLPIPQPQPIQPLFQQPQQFQITTAPIITQTMVTNTQSKILKLTFGAKTAYTTIFSTTVVPTLLTTFVTQSVPFVQATPAAFPGYFPAQYPGFPYVG